MASAATTLDYASFKHFSGDSAPVFFSQLFAGRLLSDSAFRFVDLTFWEYLESNDPLPAVLIAMILATREPDGKPLHFKGVNYKGFKSILRSNSSFTIKKIENSRPGFSSCSVRLSPLLNFNIHSTSTDAVDVYFRNRRSFLQTTRTALYAQSILKLVSMERYFCHLALAAVPFSNPEFWNDAHLEQREDLVLVDMALGLGILASSILWIFSQFFIRFSFILPDSMSFRLAMFYSIGYWALIALTLTIAFGPFLMNFEPVGDIPVIGAIIIFLGVMFIGHVLTMLAYYVFGGFC
mmetsp:Transcript_11886/g.15489  ORF Transcript_11886/g.15489 Transcript_11886/m.15489 type:complete len:294 (+) Transcript_11886:141-1022(+)